MDTFKELAAEKLGRVEEVGQERLPVPQLSQVHGVKKNEGEDQLLPLEIKENCSILNVRDQFATRQGSGLVLMIHVTCGWKIRRKGWLC